MRRALRLLLPALAIIAAVPPSAAAEPRAKSAAVRHAEAALEEVQDLRAGRGVRTGRELTLALRELTLNMRHLRGDALAKASQVTARPKVKGETDCSSPTFCVHGLGVDANNLTAQQVLEVADHVDDYETGTLGWRPAPSDGESGGDEGKVDIYLVDVGADQIFGYAQTEPVSSKRQPSFLVLDDDFANPTFQGLDPALALRVTLAHEYGHVLQYGYDVLADPWHFESSATWLENRVYPADDDWLRYVLDGPNGSGWGSLTELPLTAFDHADDQPRNAKPYGTVVFNHYLAGRFGDALQRRTWELSDGLRVPSTRAYDTALKEAGSAGLASTFAEFSTATSEWQLPGSGFQLANRLPHVERQGTIGTDGGVVSPLMDHLTFALYDVAVPDPGTQRIRFAAAFPAGVRSALALVARDGSGEVTTELAELAAGGVAGVTLDRPHELLAGGGRITAVLVNADSSEFGWSDQALDWLWQRDDQRVTAAVTSDVAGPGISARTPAPDASRVRPRAQVQVTFTKPVSGVDETSFSLRGPDGRRVRAAVTYVRTARTAILVPSTPLADGRRYTVRLSDSIMDQSATPLAPSEWSFTTVTRNPRARLGVADHARGARLRLRSKDGDRLRWTAKMRMGGRTVARASGRIKPGAVRNVRLRTRRTGRARVVLVLRDPQDRRTRIKRSLRLRP